MRSIDPHTAQALLAEGATLIDIRERDAHRRARIPGSRCVPLAELDGGAVDARGSGPLIFHCQSGLRTRTSGPALAAAAGDRDACVLDGGIAGWTRAGLAIQRSPGAVLDIGRQVQLVVGGLALAGSLLAATVSPWFLLVSGGVGAGLLFAGITGVCGLALGLARMPWNRPPPDPARPVDR